jgi:hypothetical protein
MAIAALDLGYYNRLLMSAVTALVALEKGHEGPNGPAKISMSTIIQLAFIGTRLEKEKFKIHSRPNNGVIAFYILVLLVTGAGSILSFKMHDTSLEAVARPQESKNDLIAQARRMDLQRVCAEQSDKSFKMEGYVPKPNVMNSYTSHYNSTLSRCFILFHTWDASNIATTGVVSTFESLQDPFEGVDYGDYFQSHETKGLGAPKDTYVDCHIDPPKGQRQICHSDVEWESMKNRYMRD